MINLLIKKTIINRIISSAPAKNISEVNLGGDNMKVNKSIGCTVNECKYHAKQESFCSLDHINVVKHHDKANSPEATDCGSFEVGM